MAPAPRTAIIPPPARPAAPRRGSRPGTSLAVEIGLDPAEGLARQDVQLHRDQRPVPRIEDRVRSGRPDQPVAPIGPRTAQGGDLRILAERVGELPVPREDLLAQGLQVDPSAADPVHLRDQRLEVVSHDEIRALRLEGLHRRRRALPAAGFQDLRPACRGQVRVLLGPRQREFLLDDLLGQHEP
jgi:hypothetical protein